MARYRGSQAPRVKKHVNETWTPPSALYKRFTSSSASLFLFTISKKKNRDEQPKKTTTEE